MKDEYYAHSRDGKPPEDWQRLEDHLNEVAEKARVFANEFNAGDWAYLAGLWHDLRNYVIKKEEYFGGFHAIFGAYQKSR